MLSSLPGPAVCAVRAAVERKAPAACSHSQHAGSTQAACTSCPPPPLGKPTPPCPPPPHPPTPHPPTPFFPQLVEEHIHRVYVSERGGPPRATAVITLTDVLRHVAGVF
jgi:hypothetical protein